MGVVNPCRRCGCGLGSAGVRFAPSCCVHGVCCRAFNYPGPPPKPALDRKSLLALRALPGDTMTRITTGLLIAILAVTDPGEAFALITGGEGNKPITDPGWPAGAAAIFNHTG